MKSNKNQWLRHSATHDGSKAKQTELVRTSLKQHSVFNAFFTYGTPLSLPRPEIKILLKTSIFFYQNVLGGICQPAVRRNAVLTTKQKQGSG